MTKNICLKKKAGGGGEKEACTQQLKHYCYGKEKK